MMRSRFSAGLAVAAALAMGALAGGAVAEQAGSQKAVQVTSARRFDTRRSLFGGGDAWSHNGQRRAAYGWTNAHQKRVAKKARNQARNRRACRGRR